MRNKIELVFIFVSLVLVSSVLAQDISEAEKLFKEGMKYYRKADDEKAIETMQKAVQLNPDYAEAYEMIGQAYGRLQKQPESTANYEKARDAYQRLGNEKEVERLNGALHTQAVLDDLEKKMMHPTKEAKVKVLSPKPGAVFHPGDSVQVKIEAEEKVTMVFLALAPYATELLTKKPFEHKFLIPIDAKAGTATVMAGARDQSGESFGSHEVEIKIIK